MKKSASITLFILVLLAGAFLRFFALQDQPVVFFDEANIVNRVVQIRMFLLDRQSCPEGLAKLYIDLKLLWILMIAFLRVSCASSFLAGKYLSAGLGMGGIVMTFLLAKELYRSRAVGLLSALFLAVSSFHVFYSRLVLPDAGAMFFMLSGAWIYAEKSRRGWGYAALAGSCFGAAILIHYRVAFVAIFIVFLEMRNRRERGKSIRGTIQRSAAFAVSALTVMALFELCARMVLNLSYFEALAYYVHRYSGCAFEPFAFFAYLYFVYLYDGPVIVLLMAASLLFWKAKYPTGFIAFFVFCCLGLISAAVFKFPRVMSPLLPFIAILCAVTCANVYGAVKSAFLKRTVAVAIGLALVWNCFNAFQEVSRWEAGIKDAAGWLRHHAGKNSGIIATNHVMLSGYVPQRPIIYFNYHTHKEQLADYVRMGVRYAVIDPHKLFIDQPQSTSETVSASLIAYIESHCSPQASYQAFNPRLFERVMHEHDYPSLRETGQALRYVKPEDNQINVYDLQRCSGAPVPVLGEK